MISTAISPSTLFSRSMAVNTPLVAGAGAIVAGMVMGIRLLTLEDETRKNKRAFLRSLAGDNDGISNEMLLFFQGSDDPVREALRAIANPETEANTLRALRRALATSL